MPMEILYRSGFTRRNPGYLFVVVFVGKRNDFRFSDEEQLKNINAGQMAGWRNNKNINRDRRSGLSTSSSVDKIGINLGQTYRPANN
jgi:hypothetical protein